MGSETLGYAEIVAKEEARVEELDRYFFRYDTASETWEEAVESLNSHYHNEVHPEEPLMVYWFRWVSGDDGSGSIDFGAEYPKLEHEVFPTIRRYDSFGDVGDVLEVVLEDD